MNLELIILIVIIAGATTGYAQRNVTDGNASATALPTTRISTTTLITTTTAPTTTAITTTPKPKHFSEEVKFSFPYTFDCTYRKIPDKVVLRKDGGLFFSVDLKNFQYDRSKFVVSTGKEKMMIKLKRTGFDDQGYYMCRIFYGSTGIIDQTYNLTVIGKPIVSLGTYMNTTVSLSRFQNEVLLLVCNAVGNPKPLVAWYSNDYASTKPNELEATIKVTFVEIKNITLICNATNSEGSTYASVKVHVKDPNPSPPLHFRAIEREQTSITVAWDANIPGNAQLSYYEINNNQQLGTTYKKPGLKPFHSYNFSLRACNTNRRCSPEIKIYVRTLEQKRPSEPTNIAFSDITADSFTINFVHGQHLSRQNISYTEVCYFQSYISFSCEASHPEKSCRHIDPDQTNLTTEKLFAFTNYTVILRTCIENKNVTCSACVTKETQTTMAASSAVQCLAVENSKSPKVELLVSWQSPVFLNAPYVTYTIEYHEKNAIKSKVVNSTFQTNFTRPSSDAWNCSLTPAFIYSLGNLDGSKYYFVKVVARNQKGSTYSETKRILADEAVPSRVTNLRLLQATSSSLKIAWDALNDEGVSYVVTYKKNGSIFDGQSVKDLANPSVSIPNLKEKTAYDIHVQGQIKRKRDKKVLSGADVTMTLCTVSYVEKKQVNVVTLTIVTVVMAILVILVIIGALIYCRRHGLCAVKYSSTFYTDEKDQQRTTLSFGLRQSLKTIELKRVPMSLEEFKKHVQDLHSNSDYLFSEEYGSLGPNRPDRTFHTAHAKENVQKNRYIDIAAYDQTRVRLMSLDGVLGSNYINANFVDGYHKGAAYIATQAPLTNTLHDFWRMIWETDCRIVVMLTNLMERGRIKCNQYWPSSSEEVANYQGYEVQLVSTRKYACYVIRELDVTKKSHQLSNGTLTSPGGTRKIYQYHYTEWPDFGVPRERTSIISFILHTREHENEVNSPVIVHCSAGVGRTGTFIALDAQMRRFVHRQDVEIYNFLKKIRLQRNFLVQQEVQYIFVHDALLDSLCAGNTQIPLMGMEMILNQDYWSADETDTKLKIEWRLHQRFANSTIYHSSGQRPCNRPKNRDETILPVDLSRVHLLMEAVTEGTDYINASFINSYHLKNAYIVTQTPLQNTIEDFWRLIWEQKAQIVINLLTLEECERDDIFAYLPIKVDESMKIGRFKITMKEEKAENNYVKRVLSVSNSEADKNPRELHHYHFYNWVEDFFPRTAFLFELVMDVLKCQEECVAGRLSTPSPMVIHCRCGVGRSGVLCALFSLKEQIEDPYETVDVSSTVRLLQFQRPNIIQTEEQYDFLYKALVSLKHYLSRMKEETNESNE